MLEDVEVSRSLMKRMKSTGKMTEPWGTPALMKRRLERKLSTLTAIDLLERKLPILYCSIILSIRQFHNVLLNSADNDNDDNNNDNENDDIKSLQKTCLLETATILRRVLSA